MAAMQGFEASEMANEMATGIAARVEDPAKWMLEVRRLVVAMGLDVTKAIVATSGCTLDMVCWKVMERAVRESRSVEDVRAALRT